MEIPKAPQHQFPLPQGRWHLEHDDDGGELAVYRTAAGRLIAMMPADDYRRMIAELDAEKS